MTGETVSHYRILERLGSGGMGVVYLAHDTRLDRRVALKVLGTNVGPRAAARLTREARTASSLNHPHVCTIYEIGDVGGGLPFIAMELVEGRTLKSLIESGPQPVDLIVRLGTQISDAMAAAHAKGIVHRDLKPANIVVTTRGDAKILDFGLARSDQESAAASDETSAHWDLAAPTVVPGTAAYMSPEQARGEKVDERSDLFSIGVVLHEMATGTSPFRDETRAGTLARVQSVSPPPATQLNPQVPVELARIILKALDKDRELRYQKAAELRTDLRRLQRQLMPSALPDQRLGRRLLAVWRGRVAVWSGAGIGAMLLAATVGYFATPQSIDLDSIAVMPFVNTSANSGIEYMADGITDGLINNLSELRDLRVVPRTVVFRYKGKTSDPRELGRSLNARAVVTGRLAQHGDVITVGAELVSAADESQLWGSQLTGTPAELQRLQRSLTSAIVRRLGRHLTPEAERRLERQYTPNARSYHSYLRGRYYGEQETPEGIWRAVEMFRESVALDPSYTLAYVGLADAYGMLAYLRLLPVEDGYREVKAAAEKALALDDTLAEAHYAVAEVKAFFDRDHADAERRFLRALELDDRNPFILMSYALHLASLGRRAEAVDAATRAYALDPLTLSVNRSLMWVYYFTRDYDRAVAQAEQTLALDPHLGTNIGALVLALIGKGVSEHELRARVARHPMDAATEEWVEACLLAAYAPRPTALAAIRRIAGEAGAVSPLLMGTLFALAGDTSSALSWLERGYREHDLQGMWINVHPLFDGLRSLPAFQDLVRRSGFAR